MELQESRSLCDWNIQYRISRRDIPKNRQSVNNFISTVREWLVVIVLRLGLDMSPPYLAPGIMNFDESDEWVHWGYYPYREFFLRCNNRSDNRIWPPSPIYWGNPRKRNYSWQRTFDRQISSSIHSLFSRRYVFRPRSRESPNRVGTWLATFEINKVSVVVDNRRKKGTGQFNRQDVGHGFLRLSLCFMLNSLLFRSRTDSSSCPRCLHSCHFDCRWYQKCRALIRRRRHISRTSFLEERGTWSAEEDPLLVKLKEEENLTTPKVTRRFDKSSGKDPRVYSGTLEYKAQQAGVVSSQTFIANGFYFTYSSTLGEYILSFFQS